MLRYENISHTV